MTSAAVMDYASLLDDLCKYTERTDLAFTQQRPRFVMLGENRIASEARGLGFIRSVTGDMVTGVTGSAMDKPDRWRETVSLTIGTSTGYRTRVPLYSRSYEYCRLYAPDSSVTDQPKFYADWDWGHWLIAPSPDDAYPFELLYHERPQPLDSDNTTNWTTEFSPQLLLFACLLETSTFIKRADLIASYKEGYERALKQVEFEGKRQMVDRTNSRTGGA